MILFTSPDKNSPDFTEDKTLSIKAKYIVFSLLKYQFNEDEKLFAIADKLGMTRRLLRSGFKELEQNGYLNTVTIKANIKMETPLPKLYLFSVNKYKLRSGEMAQFLPTEKQLRKIKLESLQTRFYPQKKILRIKFPSHARERIHAHSLNNTLRVLSRSNTNIGNIVSFLHSFDNTLRVLPQSSKKGNGLTRERVKPDSSVSSIRSVRKSAKVKIVWDCWNEFASKKNSLIPKHKAGTKKERRITAAIKNALGKYTEVEICEAIENFVTFLSEKCPVVYRRFPGFYKIQLDEFIRFSPMKLEHIAAHKTSKKIIQHHSWLRLCLGGAGLLEEKFSVKSKIPKDIDPKIIKQFEKSWVKFIGKSSTERDKNNFSIAAKKLLQYVQTNKRHLGYDPADSYWIYKFVREFVFGYLVKLQSELEGRKTIHSGYLTQDFFYEDQLTKHIKFLGIWRQ